MALAQKLWAGKQLNTWNRQQVLKAIQQTGRKLPCSVVSATTGFVKVKFEVVSGFTLDQITIPVTDPEYIRVPYQPGDKGFCVAADAQISGVSGQGGVADLTTPPNLSALAFQPIGNEGWIAVPGNMLVLYGPAGVSILDSTANNSSVQVTSTGVTVSGKTNVAIGVPGGTSVTLTPALLELQVGTSVGLTINGVPGITTSVVISGHNITTVNGIVTVLT